jgi:hypothetical protein
MIKEHMEHRCQEKEVKADQADNPHGIKNLESAAYPVHSIRCYDNPAERYGDDKPMEKRA